MKSHFQIIVSAFALLIFGPALWAQSAEQEALSNLVDYGWSQKDKDPKLAVSKLTQALTTAEKLGDDQQTARCSYMLAVVYHSLVKYSDALDYAKKAKEQYKINQSAKGLVRSLDLLGNIRLKSGNYLLASQYYTEAIDLILITPELSPELGYAYLNYATLFQEMSFNEKALEYFQKAEESLADSDPISWHIIISNKAQIYLETRDWGKADQLSKTTYTFFSTQEDIEMMAKSLNVQGNVALFEERYTEATRLFSEALSLVVVDSITNVEGRINYLVNLSKSYLGEGKISASYQAVRKAQFLAKKQLGTLAGELICVKQLGNYYRNQGVLDSAIHYVLLSDSLSYLIYDQGQSFSILMADSELQAHENTIELNEMLNTQTYLYLGLIGLGLLLVVIGGAFWQYGQKKKTQLELMLEQEKNQEQLLQGVIKEQELKSISYIIEGQESEKKRVAEELHDGLGGTLAAVRISLEQFRRQLQSQDALELQDFDYAFDLLREATEDVRRISHDMGAVRLKHGGLVTALEDMCRNLSRHQSFVASLDTEGIEMLRINSEVEFHLYRIAQELFQNIIKHADANSVKIQLTNAGGRLHLYMWDDGNGFDVDAVADGMGMQNLKIRTQQLNGKIHIDSTIGKGTYTHISLPV